MRSTILLALLFCVSAVGAGRPLEKLDRGVVVIRQNPGTNFISWRMLATDSEGVAFDLYRREGAEAARKLNPAPLTQRTWFEDTTAPKGTPLKYSVRALTNAAKAFGSSEFILQTNAQPFLSIPLQTPEGYAPNDGSVGDLDGDGEYEIVVHQVGRGRDNSQAGLTTEPILEAYKLDGTFLWRINLGKNIREGAHYTQFLVYDFDGDGRAEVVCKTADGTTDGKGRVIGDADADWRSKTGRTLGKILEGPEYLTVFDGLSGGALATTDYIPSRGNVADWGDNYGNRVDRFLACVAYLDGSGPSIVMCRGYYTRTVLAAWNWRDGKLSHVWTFDSDDGTPGNEAYRGQGNHNLAVADVDRDGKDEIIYGAAVIDDDGKGLYSTGLGHGDALHVSDLDPMRPGLEVFNIQERFDDAGANFRNAATGEVYWKKPSVKAGADGEGPGRGAAFDIDPRHPGHECWVAGAGITGLFNARGEKISDRAPRTCNMGIWWDGDLLRELLNGVRITKWDYLNGVERDLFSAADFDCVSNNGSKSNPVLCADILGDWREEIVARTRDNKELRIFTSTIPTQHRRPTLMHDAVYRLGVASQNVGYNQPAHPSFILGAETNAPTAQTDDEFLEMVQQAAFRFFWEEVNPSNGLIRDRSRFDSFCSIASVGFGLTGIGIGMDHGWITREEGIERVRLTLKTFRDLPQGSDATGVAGHKGWFYHFLEMDSGLRFRKVELSSIDSALLFAGMLYVAEYFDRAGEEDIRSTVETILGRVDWEWMLNGDRTLTMGWHPETGFIKARWKGYNEASILYILGIGNANEPLTKLNWEAWTSTYYWATNYGYSYVQFPPLFGHQYSACWIDFRAIADDYMRGKGITYFENSRRATLAQRAYCIANPLDFTGYSSNVWGITACDGPGRNGVQAYAGRGAPPPDHDDGTIAPTGPGGSIPFAPEECIAALRHMYDTYREKIWGRYGFADAFHLGLDWWDPEVIGIDQGAILLMIENYRTGKVWEVMRKNKTIQRGLNRAGFVAVEN